MKKNYKKNHIFISPKDIKKYHFFLQKIKQINI